MSSGSFDQCRYPIKYAHENAMSKGNCLFYDGRFIANWKSMKKIIFISESIYIIHMECDGWCVVSVCQKVLMLNTKCTDIFACKKPTNAYPNCYRMDIPFYVIAYSFIFIFRSYAWYIPHIIAYNTNTPRAREENKRIKKTESEYIAMVTRSRWHNDYIGALYMPKTNDE